MPKKTFRKKPVVIEAVQLNQSAASQIEIIDWVRGNGGLANAYYKGVVIHTLEGEVLAIWGDWVIKGVQGEFYPCNPDLFEATYGEVDSNEY